MVQRILMIFQAHHPQSESPKFSHLNWCTDLMFIFSPKLWERYVQYRKRGELRRDVQVADDRRQLFKDMRVQNRCQKLQPRNKGAFPCFKEGLCCLEQMNFQSSTTPQIVHVETQKLDCWLAKHSKHVLAERSATGWLLQIDFVRNDGMMSSLMKLKVCSLVPYPTKWHMCRAAMWVDTLLKWSYLSSHSKEQYQGRQHVDICIFFIHSNFNHHLLFVEASTIVRNPLLKIPEISPSTVSGWKRCLFSFGEFAIFSSLIFYFHGRTIFYVYHLFVAWT